VIILENISKKVTEVAQVAAKKSSEVVEITKLNISINTEEDKIQKLYEEIGRIVYNYFKSQENVPDELKEVCAEIQQSETNIKNHKRRILEIKSLKLCGNCGAELGEDVNFCPQCGARQQTSNGKGSKNNAEDNEDKKVDKNKNVSNDLPDDEDKTDDTSNDMTESDNPLGDEQA
jgi:uncharacterized membrane protein YvbJ